MSSGGCQEEGPSAKAPAKEGGRRHRSPSLLCPVCTSEAANHINPGTAIPSQQPSHALSLILPIPHATKRNPRPQRKCFDHHGCLGKIFGRLVPQANTIAWCQVHTVDRHAILSPQRTWVQPRNLNGCHALLPLLPSAPAPAPRTLDSQHVFAALRLRPAFPSTTKHSVSSRSMGLCRFLPGSISAMALSGTTTMAPSIEPHLGACILSLPSSNASQALICLASSDLHPHSALDSLPLSLPRDLQISFEQSQRLSHPIIRQTHDQHSRCPRP